MVTLLMVEVAHILFWGASPSPTGRGVPGKRKRSEASSPKETEEVQEEPCKSPLALSGLPAALLLSDSTISLPPL